ncbi:MAG: YtfJ family protein [Smithellaceae bacterium]
MKRTISAVFFVLLWCVLPAWASELKVGEKALNFSLKDSQGTIYSLDSDAFRGKVLSILYVAPNKRDLNNNVENVLLKDQGLDRNKTYKSFVITNLKATRMPNFIVKCVLKNKQEKTGSIILLDDQYTILNLWGLKDHASDLVILDKDRICRYIYFGKLPPEEMGKIVNIIKEYQVK